MVIKIIILGKIVSKPIEDLHRADIKAKNLEKASANMSLKCWESIYVHFSYLKFCINESCDITNSEDMQYKGSAFVSSDVCTPI